MFAKQSDDCGVKRYKIQLGESHEVVASEELYLHVEEELLVPKDEPLDVDQP